MPRRSTEGGVINKDRQSNEEDGEEIQQSQAPCLYDGGGNDSKENINKNETAPRVPIVDKGHCATSQAPLPTSEASVLQSQKECAIYVITSLIAHGQNDNGITNEIRRRCARCTKEKIYFT